jgi:NADH:ubiquinone oxidoreductase subunit F (NADH-binding)
MILVHMNEDLVPTLESLHARQEQRGYLVGADIEAVASEAGVAPADLYGAVLAYPRFRMDADAGEPAVCAGPACLMHAAPGVRASLGASAETHCLGLCDQPVAVLTRDGPRIACGPTALAAPESPLPDCGGRESAFFGEDDPLETTRAALARPARDLIAAVAESGLQGRGGGGFPAGRKWYAVRAAGGERKFVVCNADESEPGTYKDRVLLDHQPLRVIAGMRLAAHAVGASAGLIYIRYEYRSQYHGLLRTIERLREQGLLGERFDVAVRRGAGSYVCGEETALLESLEGQRPTPRDRPPYPFERGLLGAPTLIQNVETLAAVPAIVARGPAWFREIGRPKLYCVSGDVPTPRTFELPMTTSARELVERAGASADGVKAFTLGGISGGLLPGSRLDVRLDFEDPRRYGAALGSGGVIVAGRSRCLVRFVLGAMRFFSAESCGKCFPCRIGTLRLRERLEAAIRREELPQQEVRELIEVLAAGSACGLGTAAGLLVRHLLEHFGDEVDAHGGGSCPAGECEVR